MDTLKSEDDADVPKVPNDYFKYVKMGAYIGGLNLRHRENSFRFKIYTGFVLTSMICYIPVQIYEIVASVGVFEHFGHLICFNIAYCVSVLKFVLVLYNKNKILHLMDQIQSGLFAPSRQRGGKKEFLSINNRLRKINTQIFVYILITCLTFTPAVASSMYKRLNKPKEEWQCVLFPTYTKFFRQSPHHDINCAFQFIIVFFASWGAVVSDALLVTFFGLISLQFEFLWGSVQDMLEKVKKTELDLVNQFAKKFVVYHQEIYNMADRIESTYNKFFVVEFVGNCISLILSMYFVATMGQQNVVKFGPFYVVLLIQLTLPCYWGTEIATQSQRAAAAIAESDWPGTDIRFQKALLRMIQRAQKPVIFTAGKFIFLSLENYVKILKIIYTYYTMLQNKRLQ